MAARLDLVKHVPRRIADVGAGAGAGLALLRERYPGAEIVVTDFARAPLGRARRAPSLAARLRASFGVARAHFVCADMSALPLATGACGMLWSNLALAWAPDPSVTLAEWHRALEVGGLLMFTSYGPDTLKELRAAFAPADERPHVHPFADMHDLGDALVAAGFADPVLDVDVLTVTYSRLEDLFRDLRATGQRNAHDRRRRSLGGRGRWARMRAAYAALARDGRVPATFEIVYGHAWKAPPRKLADGRAIIRVDRLPRTRKPD
jgi:malonyl-CoA O-methyltransferase